MGTLYPWPATLSSNKQRVLQELVAGQQCATELQIIVHKPSQQGSAEELVQKILRSFDQTICMLTADEAPRNPASYDGGSSYCDDCKSQDSCESSKKPSNDKRGCYKRKRGAQTWTMVSDKVEDVHSWRKYGQKNILNSKHPRSYYRCTNKYDQGCTAIKQVQRMEDDSQMYHITYIGTHTCINSSSMAPKSNGSPNPTLKPESEEEVAPSDVTELGRMNMWKDVTMDGGGGCFESEYGDQVSNVYSCSEITCLNLVAAELENDFHFDEIEFDL